MKLRNMTSLYVVFTRTHKACLATVDVLCIPAGCTILGVMRSELGREWQDRKPLFLVRNVLRPPMQPIMKSCFIHEMNGNNPIFSIFLEVYNLRLRLRVRKEEKDKAET